MSQSGTTKKIRLLTLFLAALLTGCGGSNSISPAGSEHTLAIPAISRSGDTLQGPYPAPGDELAPYFGSPPLAVLFAGEQQQIAALGSYCWIQEMQDGSPVEACLDSSGLPTPQVFLPSSVHFNGRLRLPLPFPPAAVSVYSMPVTLSDTLQPPSNETILWSYKEGETLVLGGEIEQELRLELQPGLNVLYVDARWEGLGSAGYGFLIEAVGE